MKQSRANGKPSRAGGQSRAVGRRFMDRLIDVTARRPAGLPGRLIYRQPAGHEASFVQVMEALGPLDGDRCLEIGCGGGVLLERVLAAGARSAAGLDHSADMLALSIARNAEALATDRLAVKLGDASAIPWADQSFDAVFTANMFFYVKDPAAVLGEVFRVLRPGGRLVIHTTPGPLPAPSLKTLWVLIPMVSAMNVHTDAEMSDLYASAGFTDVTVTSNGFFNQLSRGFRPGPGS
jgi:ubiquinone/menaquinone biosynthesis C-methylase UbiE